MGLYKRGKIWWLSYTVNGRRCRVSTGKRTRKQAEEVETRLRASLLDGSYVPEERRRSVLESPPFDAAVVSYVECRVAEGKKRHSYQHLERCWKIAFAGRRVDAITSEEIERLLGKWQTERNWSNASRNSALAQLSGLFSYCYSRRWIDSHPTERGRVPKLAVDNERERWLRTPELNAICLAADRLAEENGHEDRPWLSDRIRFMAATGMRFGEVNSLTRASFEKDEQNDAYLVVRETKNGRPLYFPVVGDVLAIMERRLERAPFPASFLFPGPGGGNGASSFRRFFKRAVLKAAKEDPGLDLEWGESRHGITIHTLRHTMASLALNGGLSEYEIQVIGNWKDPRMVRRYGRFSHERLRESAAKVAAIVSGASAHSVTITRMPISRPDSSGKDAQN